MGQKKWYRSRMLWTNLIALGAVVGLEISAEESVALLAVINILLRLVTKEGLTW